MLINGLLGLIRDCWHVREAKTTKGFSAGVFVAHDKVNDGLIRACVQQASQEVVAKSIGSPAPRDAERDARFDF